MNNSNLLHSNILKEIKKGKSADYLIEKYVLHNKPFFFKDSMDLFFDIKKEISEHFDIPITNIFLVGSGQFGFSLNPDKNYRNFIFDDGEEENESASDLDFAIISPSLFEKIWFSVFDYCGKDPAISHSDVKDICMFKDYLFKGWIRPDAFPHNIAIKKDWFEFFNKLNVRVNRQVACGVFKNEKYFIQKYKKSLNTLIKYINGGKYEKGSTNVKKNN